MTCTSLFSGSGGNCVFLKEGSTRILVDAGVSFRRIASALGELGEEVGSLDGVFFTHEHSDHVGALPMLLKKTSLPLYLAEECAAALYRTLLERDAALAELFCERVRTVRPGESYALGEAVFSPFSLPHDSAACLGAVFGTERREKCVGIATDLGAMTTEARRALAGCESVVLESNHDPEMLENGPYPPYLIERIRSEQGHLSNPDCGAFLQVLAASGCRRALLFHLSKENNTPACALASAHAALALAGAEAGDMTVLTAAPDSRVALF